MITSRLLATSLAVATVVAAAGGWATNAQEKKPSADDLRKDAIARARVWNKVNVAAMDIRRGPGGPGSFAPNAVVDCVYVQKDMSGNTPKFTCRLASGAEIKVKHGRDNGEVYAEVAGTRLLWALGFGGDHMYPVQVRCRACPYDDYQGPATAKNEIRMIEAASVERKMNAGEFDHPDGEGWAWDELDLVDPRRGGASIAERDALKLLAAFLQHTDSKKEQQRLVCLEARDKTETCRQPFMLVSDLGMTFGRGTILMRHSVTSVNLKAWASVPIWDDETGCRARLRSGGTTGTIGNPVISEAGRQMLAGLLGQLTERQIRDLFTVARFPMRTDAGPGAETQEIDGWVTAFKEKVLQIKERKCTPSRPS